MMKNLKTKSSAKVVDGKLILSFPHALTPVVWQMDLSEVKASALEVLKESESYALTLKTPKGEKLNAATFETRDEAIKGLLAASKALENAQGRIRPEITAGTANTNIAYPRKSGGWKKVIGGIAAVLVLLFIAGVWNASQQLNAQQGFEQTASASINGQPGAPASNAGVPMSADDFLSGL